MSSPKTHIDRIAKGEEPRQPCILFEESRIGEAVVLDSQGNSAGPYREMFLIVPWLEIYTVRLTDIYINRWIKRLERKVPALSALQSHIFRCYNNGDSKVAVAWASPHAEVTFDGNTSR